MRSNAIEITNKQVNKANESKSMIKKEKIRQIFVFYIYIDHRWEVHELGIVRI